jgi:hypothetical protein
LDLLSVTFCPDQLMFESTGFKAEAFVIIGFSVQILLHQFEFKLISVISQWIDGTPLLLHSLFRSFYMKIFPSPFFPALCHQIKSLPFSRKVEFSQNALLDVIHFITKMWPMCASLYFGI